FVAKTVLALTGPILRMKIIVIASIVLSLSCPLTAGEPPRAFALNAQSPQFWKLVSRDAKLGAVVTGLGFTEGPVWDPAGFLYVSDETLNKIFRVYPDGGRQELIDLGDPDGSTFDRQHRLLNCASVLRAIIQVTTSGQYKVLADRYEGKRFNSPNDLVTGPDGAIYFTDPTLDLVQGEKQEIPFQGVYRLDRSEEHTSELQSPCNLVCRLL